MNSNPNNPGDFLNSPQAAALLKNKAALQSLLQSPDAIRLMQLLNQQGGNLNAAARQARQGDTKAISSMLNSLTQTKEGAELVNRLSQNLNHEIKG